MTALFSSRRRRGLDAEPPLRLGQAPDVGTAVGEARPKRVSSRHGAKPPFSRVPMPHRRRLRGSRRLGWGRPLRGGNGTGTARRVGERGRARAHQPRATEATRCEPQRGWRWRARTVP